MSDILSYIISAAILLVVGWAVWRGGGRNPVGTGTLLHDVNNIRMEVTALKRIPEEIRDNRHAIKNQAMKIDGLAHQLGKTASTDALVTFEREMEGRLSHVEERLASSATREDVERVRGEVGRVQAAIEHICKQNDKTDASVVRIEQILLRKANS